jgi:hypothetical protein
MKKMLYANITLLLLCAMFFVLDFFVVDYVNRFLFFTPMVLLFIEAGVFLFTFKHMKKSTLRIIRRILGVYCSIAIAIVIGIKIYSAITGYVFIYYSYSALLLTLIIYPSILWVMIRLMTLNSMINNRGIIATITTMFTVGILLINGIIIIMGSSTIEIVERPNEDNIVLVTQHAFFHSSTMEYRQKNLFFMEK